jgi:hypothetical protein
MSPTNQVLLAINQCYPRGNATDLSLLTHMTVEDIGRLQSVGREAQESRKQFILHDDQVRYLGCYFKPPAPPKPLSNQEAVWSHVQTLKGARVDIVLDNSGFEVRITLKPCAKAK